MSHCYIRVKIAISCHRRLWKRDSDGRRPDVARCFFLLLLSVSRRSAAPCGHQKTTSVRPYVYVRVYTYTVYLRVRVYGYNTTAICQINLHKNRVEMVAQVIRVMFGM